MKNYKSLMRNITGSQITCFWTSTLNNAYWQSIKTKNDLLIEYVKYSCLMKNFDGQCHVRKISRKNKCFFFIDFEYNLQPPELEISDTYRFFLIFLIQLKLVNSNSLNSNFWITRVFPTVPTFFLHKVTKFTSDNSRLDNSRIRLTRGDFFVPRP